MLDFLLSYRTVLETTCIFSGFALSQYIALRGGLFAISTAGFASIGAYCAAILLKTYGLHPFLSGAAATLLSIAAGLVLSWPLARLNGHFQAIATLAFVEIVRTLALYAEGLTGGALGINGIPKVVGLGELSVFLAVLVVFLSVLSRTGIGRAFDAIRQDEVVARSLGISVSFYHTLAFGLSAGIAGLSGAMLAFDTYSITPEQFGFPLIVVAIGAVMLGGRNFVAGPIVGTAVIVFLPELARPLSDNRTLLYGAILILSITYLPQGLLGPVMRRFASRRQPAPLVLKEQKHG
jgi:branched-chain amino acid transport system permease protein